MAGVGGKIKIQVNLQEIERLKKEIADVKKQILNLSGSDVQKYLDGLNQKYQDLNKQLQAAGEEAMKMARDIDSLNEKYNQQKSTIEQYENQIISLTEQLKNSSKSVSSPEYQELEKDLHKIESAYEKATQEAENMQQAISQKMGITGNIDKFFDGVEKNSDNFIDAINRQREAIKKMELDYINTREKMTELGKRKNYSPENMAEYEKLKKLMVEIRGDMSLEKKDLSALEKAYKQFIDSRLSGSQKEITLLTQRKQILNEMGKLELAGKSGTEEYKQLEQQLSKVGTAINIVNKNAKALTTAGSAQLAGIIQGVTGLSGAFSAFQGVSSIFVKDNEKLAAIQTKLQAAMAITIGLQQVSNTLHATSSFRINTVTKITQLWSNAQKALNTSMGLSTGLSKAFLSGGIMLLAAGIIYLITQYKEWNKQQNELKTQLSEARASIQEQVVRVKILDEVLKNNNKSYSERNNALKQLKDIMPGYNAYLSKEGKLIEDNTGALQKYVKELLNVEMAKKTIAKLADAQTKLDEFNDSLTESDKLLLNPTKELQEKWDKYGAQDSDRVKRLKKEQAELQTEVDKLSDIAKEYIASDATIYEDFTKGYWEAQQKNAQARLYAMKDFQKGSEEWNQVLAEYNQATIKLKAWDVKPKTDKEIESAADKARKQSQEIADQNEKIKQLVDKQGLERKRQNEDLINQEIQASISSMQSGAEKVRRQKELDNKLEIQALERQKEDYIQKVIQNERELFEAQEELKLKQDKKYVKKIFDPTSVRTDTSLFDSMIGYTQDSQQNKSFEAIDKAWNEYFIKFGNYQQKRVAIVEKYNKEIAEAQTGGNKAALEKEMNNQLDDLDNSVKNSTTLMGQLFADTSQKSVGEIQKIIDKAELLMQYIEAVKDGEGNAMIGGKSVSKDDIKGLGISENTINNLQLSTQELEALRNAINKLKGDLGGKSPFKLFETQIKDAYKSIKEGITSGDSKKIGVGISNIGGAIQGITPELKEFGDSMGQIFGEQTGDDINTIVDLLGNTAQIGQSVGKIMAGDVVGGIKDAVTGIGNIFAMGSEASKRHKEALKVINESVKAQEHAYQLALKLKSLEYEKGDTIFGDDPYGKAINAAREYKDAIEDLKESIKGDGKIKQSGLFALFNKVPQTSDYAALQNIDIVTGHKKTGLFGWGKGKDTYSGLLKVYPDLIDSQGKFNTELAKTILSERKMSDESKATLQRIIDNADAIEEAYSVMKDYLTDIFGDLGNNMTDALVNAFQKGEDAAEAFYDSASGMIQNLVKDMINSAVIAPVIQKATEDAMKVMEDTSLTNEQRMDKLMDIVDNALEQGLAASDTAKDLYDYANKAWKDKTGEDLYKPEDSSQSTTKGGFETMTQDQAGEMNGRLTGIMETNLRSEGYLKTISEWNQPIGDRIDLSSIAMPLNLINESSSRIEQMIEENKSIAINSYYELKDINKNTKELYQMNERLGNIEKNTKGLAPK